MNAHIPDPVQKNITNVVVSILHDPLNGTSNPSMIIVEGKKFIPSNIRYQYIEKVMADKKNLCTLLAIGYFEGDPIKYGLIGNFESGKFILADYNTFTRLATSDEGFDI